MATSSMLKPLRRTQRRLHTPRPGTRSGIRSAANVQHLAQTVRAYERKRPDQSCHRLCDSHSYTLQGGRHAHMRRIRQGHPRGHNQRPSTHSIRRQRCGRVFDSRTAHEDGHLWSLHFHSLCEHVDERRYKDARGIATHDGCPGTQFSSGQSRRTVERSDAVESQ
jgi:hypothetical protein